MSFEKVHDEIIDLLSEDADPTILSEDVERSAIH